MNPIFGIVGASLVSLVQFPTIASAAEPNAELSRLRDLLGEFNVSILYPVAGIIVALIFMYFFFGFLSSVRSESPQNLEMVRRRLIFGTLAIAVFVSAWGLVSLLELLLFGSPINNI